MVQAVKIVKRIERKLEHAFVGGSFMAITASCTVLRVRHRFLFWTRTDYEVKKDVPYIQNPFYDGDYSTNNRLSVVAGELLSEAKYAITQDKWEVKGEEAK